MRKNALTKNLVRFCWIVICVILIAVSSFWLVGIALNDKKLLKETQVSDFYLETKFLDYGTPEFEELASDDKLTLLVNKPAGEVAIRLNSTNHIWYSNPQDRESDEMAIIVSRLSSQLVVNYVDLSTGSEKTVDNYVGSIRKGGLECNEIPNGICFTYTFPDQGFVIPIEYTLQNGRFSANIPVDGIKELNDSNFKILLIDLLPFFAAGGLNDDGYIFVPDGSGAIINYNNGKTTVEPYCQPVYGSDSLLEKEEKNSLTQSIRIPVFGLKTNQNAVIGIISSGEASASINATVSGISSSYNQVYAGFKYREAFTTSVTKGSQVHKIVQYGNCTLSGSTFTILYDFIQNDTQDYSGMAAAYRSYLIENDVIESPQQRINPISIELYGAIITKKNILGIEKKVVTPVTKYNETNELLKRLLSDNVIDISVQYRGWSKGGMKSTLPTAELEMSLGTYKDFSQLISTTRSNQMSLYTDADFMNFYCDGNGYYHMKHGAKLLMQDPAKLYMYRYASGKAIKDQFWYLLSPSQWIPVIREYAKSAVDKKISCVYVSGFGDMLYSDYSETRPYFRYQSQKKVQEALSELRKSFDKVSVSGGNVYAVGYADMIFNAPFDSSLFDICDYQIPFYQMVFSGYKQMTTSPINLSANSQKMFLKAVETGCSIKYAWIASDASVLSNTDYNNLFGIEIEDWYSTAVERYYNIKNLYSAIKDSVIKQHKIVSDEVSVTVYDNGITVVVNYGETAIQYQNHDIKAMSYIYYQSESGV